MAQGRWRTWGLLGALYAAQGLPYGFFSQAVPVVLRQDGASLAFIGLANLLMLPWAAKFLWAPLVERTSNPRHWILGLQLLGVICALGLAALDPSQAAVLLGAVFLTNLVAATQDIATDGLAVATLAPEDRGVGNGVQVAGYRIGMIAGGGGLLVMMDVYGWSGALGGLATLLALCALPLLLATKVGTTRPATDPAAGGGSGLAWLALPGAMPWVGLLVAFKLGDYLVQGMLRPWMVDVGLSMGDIGMLLGGAGFLAGLLGAVAGGGLINQLGRVPALVFFGLAQTAGLAGYAVTAALGAPPVLLWAAVITEHLLGGLATAALFTAMMDACRPGHGAVDYTMQASLVVLASGLGAALSGVGAELFGYAGLFGMAALLALTAPLGAMLPAATRIVRHGAG